MKIRILLVKQEMDRWWQNILRQYGTDGFDCSMCDSITFNSFEPNHSLKLQKNQVSYIDHCFLFYNGDVKSRISFQQITKASLSGFV